MKSDTSHIRLYGLKNKKINLTKTKTNQGSMKFNEFWTVLCKKTSGGFEFQTLAQKCPFTATSSSGNIIVEPEGKDERTITRNHFHKIWMRAAKFSKYEAFRPKNFQDSFNSSYTTTMMKAIVMDQNME